MDPFAVETLLPSFSTLVKEYSIEPSVAFHLWRPILSERIRRYDADSVVDDGTKSIKGQAAGESSKLVDENSSETKTPAPTLTPDEGSDDREANEIPGNLLSGALNMYILRSFPC